MDDNRATKLSLGVSGRLENLSFTLSQRPGATDFSNNATLDTGSIRSVENFIHKDI
ncbi:hypothetical protein P7K49_014816, partial [Saguinus oedipus]